MWREEIEVWRLQKSVRVCSEDVLVRAGVSMEGKTSNTDTGLNYVSGLRSNVSPFLNITQKST